MNEAQCREAVLKRSNGVCERCGFRRRLTMHHRKKRSQGGDWSPENISALCGHGTAGCHGLTESGPKEADELGFHVRPWENPAEKPILLHGRHWVFLSEKYVDAHSRDNKSDASKDKEKRK